MARLEARPEALAGGAPLRVHSTKGTEAGVPPEAARAATSGMHSMERKAGTAAGVREMSWKLRASPRAAVARSTSAQKEPMVRGTEKRPRAARLSAGRGVVATGALFT
jgi:hypothetical protein